MTQLIEGLGTNVCKDLEKKRNKILARFISWDTASRLDRTALQPLTIIERFTVLLIF
jgi:hypothetical protein